NRFRSVRPILLAQANPILLADRLEENLGPVRPVRRHCYLESTIPDDRFDRIPIRSPDLVRSPGSEDAPALGFRRLHSGLYSSRASHTAFLEPLVGGRNKAPGGVLGTRGQTHNYGTLGPGRKTTRKPMSLARLPGGSPRRLAERQYPGT